MTPGDTDATVAAARTRPVRFALSASVFLHRDGEVLILKRAGGWFIPGGHVELRNAHRSGRARNAGLIYVAPCPADAVCVLNEEHVAYRWVTPDYDLQRFLDLERLRAIGVPDAALRITAETRAVTKAVIRALHPSEGATS